MFGALVPAGIQRWANGLGGRADGDTRADLPAVATDAPPAGQPHDDKAQIYNPAADAKQLIAAAQEQARLDGKNVLIEWGGNWCGWCRLLHEVFTSDEDVRPIVDEQYELVLIDSGSNEELMRSYVGKETGISYPHLTILDPAGNVLTNQETASLEVGPKHDPQAVAAFLKKWQPMPADAEALLTAALHRPATKTNGCCCTSATRIAAGATSSRDSSATMRRSCRAITST